MSDNLRLSASNLVRAISYLPRDRRYHYIHPSTKTIIEIQVVDLPDGPISIKRWNPANQKGYAAAKVESISTEMIARVANAFIPNQPLNLDRLLAASYNTRSAFEALLAHTPEFYYCYPGRLDSYSGKVKKGHKHLIWLPNQPHEQGHMQEIETDVVITETLLEARYDALEIPDNILNGEIDIEHVRQHARIQIALILIGEQLSFRTWVASNDRGITYNNQPLAELKSVVDSLESEPTLAMFPQAIKRGRLIDCIWFDNRKYMPAVIEIEHSTGVTSGLTRMKGFYDELPDINTRFVIVASDDDRRKVVAQANLPQFRELDTRFLSYSAVEEWYALFQRRNFIGVTRDFIDSYLEPVVE